MIGKNGAIYSLWASLAAVVFALILWKPWSEEQKYIPPKKCSSTLANQAANAFVDKQISAIRNESTREYGCMDFARYVADPYDIDGSNFEQNVKAECEWGTIQIFVSDPQDMAAKKLLAFKHEAKNLCGEKLTAAVENWKSNQSTTELENRGREILDTMPAAERAEVKREWSGTQ